MIKVICFYCGQKFSKTKTEIKKTNNNFCSQRCAAIVNNKKFPKRQKKQRYCSNCKTKIKKKNKYCDDCRTNKRIICAKTISKFNKKPIETYLVNGRNCASSFLRKRLFNEKYFTRKCYVCGLSRWLGNMIPLELHHIDGNRLNNLLSNLTILCSNCHSQTHNDIGL